MHPTTIPEIIMDSLLRTKKWAKAKPERLEEEVAALTSLAMDERDALLLIGTPPLQAQNEAIKTILLHHASY